MQGGVAAPAPWLVGWGFKKLLPPPQHREPPNCALALHPPFPTLLLAGVLLFSVPSKI